MPGLLPFVPRLSFFLAAAVLAVASPTPNPAGAGPADNFDRIREAFLAKINATRSAAALAPLRLSPTLSELAQKRAETIEAGSEGSDGASLRQDALAVSEADYDSKFFARVVIQADGDVSMVYAAHRGGVLAEEILRAQSRDLGVGIARRDEVPLYVFYFGLSWQEFIDERRASLSDLPRVREQMLARVNRERATRGMAPVREAPLLDDTAQRHAEDMLARSYYGHESPEGSTVFERSQRAGYRPRFAAENIARGPSSVEEVMDGWLGSDAHRKHILSPVFDELGFGVAVGKNANGYQILWVQCFGRSREVSRRPRPP